MNLFEAKVKYCKIDEKGKDRKVTEEYVVDALTFTETESRMFEEMEAQVSGAFEVTGIKKSNVSEVIASDSDADDRWFKAKLAYVAIDEDSGAEKKTTSYMLVEASDIKRAQQRLEEHLETWIVPCDIASLGDTPVMDVLMHEQNEG